MRKRARAEGHAGQAEHALIEHERGERRGQVTRRRGGDAGPAAEDEAAVENEAGRDPDGVAASVGDRRMDAETEVERSDDRKSKAGVDEASQPEAGQQRRGVTHARARSIGRRWAAQPWLVRAVEAP